MERFSELLKGKFAFGCMRMQCRENGEIDLDNFRAMVDCYLDAGFNYFDTAHVYFDGRSEAALKDALTSRYLRGAYVLTNKLTSSCFETEADILPLFQKQLDLCGVEYFDFYLIHSVLQSNYPKYVECRAFEIAQELKARGRVKHVGMSFHDSPEFLDRVLTEHPEIEVVQIQYNWLDLDDPNVQSQACMDVCRKHGKPVLVMEPIKGGGLVFLPDAALEKLNALHEGSPAEIALRFAAEQEQVVMVLSGMTMLAQVQENVAFMKDAKPLSPEAHEAIGEVREMIRALPLVACTGCRYCTEGCPMEINIPGVFRCVNDKIKFPNRPNSRYGWVTKNGGKASDCIECGACEEICPQHLEIRELLKQAAEQFE
ncbi:MAG: aldo/keto reductase [Clostridia bacterium]|nr:aldo/keto reductase [Clostridia bacterium]